MKQRLCLLLMLALATLTARAQRTTDQLDRGLIAVPSGNGAFVSWRIFGEEYYDTQYNLYRNGVKVNSKPLNVSNYTDAQGKAGTRYQVAAVVRGVEQEKSAEVVRLNQQYLEFPVQKIYSRRGTDITSDYTINDIALADVDGDGVTELLVKRNYGPDGSSVANDSAYNHLECYRLDGQRLWYIDLGPNMVSGPDEQYDIVGYDWDGDGRAEVLMRGADNMIIHHADGTTTNIGNMTVNTRNTVLQTANMTYTNSGNEYLLYMEGATCKPYPIGPNGQLWMSYPLPRGAASDWGDGYGHRSTKHYFAAPFLDGRKPFIFLGRGCYTKHHMKAFSVDAQTHQLSLYWEWQSGNSGPYFGQGYHNFGIADVDWDGRDEIVFGSMVIDDNGQGLSTTGLGHGDAQHCSDLDPYRHGQEIFACNEDQPAMNYRDATTSKIYYRLQSTGDDGRAICGNFSNQYPGCIGASSQSGIISCVADKVISGGPDGYARNFRIYWDGDLCEEGLDGANSREGACRILKPSGAIFTADGTANCNWTKNTPSATGDILGDWREELVLRTSDNQHIRIYTTNMSTTWRNYTLWHDHQYRQGMVWESIGYNQPPHVSYFLGELEGITVAPPPLTMTGRTEVANGGTIDASLNDQHVLVCETNDTHITVAQGAKPYMVTFNIPSWVQGTNSTLTNGKAKINYTYYTCQVQGAPFSGDMRLVKQGDGTLTLPTASHTYTGETNVWAGTLNFDGELPNSPLWLNRFTELNSQGGQFRSIRMDYDAKLRPGGANQQGTMTVDTLTLGHGARVVFDVYAGQSADQIQMKQLNIQKKSWQYGPKYLTPVFEFVPHTANGELLSAGHYLLGTVQQLTGNLSDVQIEGLSTKLKAELALEDGSLYLIITGVREAGSVLWTGSESSVWDMALTENFIYTTDDEGGSSFFVMGDNVRFDDTASRFTVTLAGQLEADSVIVDNTKAYTFNGTGSLVGNTTLVKRGTGTLTIQTDNTYTGGTRISGGVLSVSSLANAYLAAGNLGGVTTQSSRFVIENGAELRTTAAVTNGSPVQFVGEEGGVINNSADYIVAGAMSGTVLNKRGSGWMKLNVNNTGLKRLIISAGTVQCVSSTTPAQTVEFQGGTLSENAGTSYAIEVPSGKRGTWNLVERGQYTNKLTGAGTLTVYCPIVVGSTWNATRTQISGNWSAFEGTVVCSVHSKDNRFTFDNSYGMPKGTLNIPSGVEVQNSGRTFRIGRLAGTGSLGGTCTFSSSGSSSVNTWQVGNDETWNSNCKVTSNANFTKVGSGRVNWNGANDNTGNTIISEGELAISRTTQLGTGMLTIAANGTLLGTNLATLPLKNSSVMVNGTLVPGVATIISIGTMYFDNKNVTFNNNGVLIVNARANSTDYDNGCNCIAGVNKLTMNGTIRVQPAEGHTLQVGDSIRIWQAAQFAGTPRFEMLGGVEWDTSRISEGLLFVKSIDTGISPAQLHERAHRIYDLNGRMVRSDDSNLDGLAPGVYISNGRKFVVK